VTCTGQHDIAHAQRQALRRSNKMEHVEGYRRVDRIVHDPETTRLEDFNDLLDDVGGGLAILRVRHVGLKGCVSTKRMGSMISRTLSAKLSAVATRWSTSKATVVSDRKVAVAKGEQSNGRWLKNQITLEPLLSNSRCPPFDIRFLHSSLCFVLFCVNLVSLHSAQHRIIKLSDSFNIPMLQDFSTEPL
jgi:hypothetical protein